MQIRMLTSEEGREFEETVTVPDGWPTEEAEKVIANYNASLRPKEKPRKLVKVLWAKVVPDTAHRWVKSNLVTINKGGRMYDTALCERCGATSKRYGFAGTYVLDKKHQKKIECRP